jgi:hypothetical protein
MDLYISLEILKISSIGLKILALELLYIFSNISPHLHPHISVEVGGNIRENLSHIRMGVGGNIRENVSLI